MSEVDLSDDLDDLRRVLEDIEECRDCLQDIIDRIALKQYALETE